LICLIDTVMCLIVEICLHMKLKRLDSYSCERDEVEC
jgi:hypothetical protein